jgi:transcriptional regulator with GAF, ATPase, and Fis domain
VVRFSVPDVRQDSRFYPGIDARTGFRTRNILAVPLHNHAGEITGAFQVLNKQQGAFTAEDQEMLKAVAAQAAIAIETAQLIGGLQQQRDALLVENTQLWQAVEGRYLQQPLLGNSPLIRQVVRLIEQLRDTSVEVLITGESGTGKELVARAFHFTRELGKGRLEMTPKAIHSLENYDWPGNVRELAHEIKRSVVLARGPHITAAELSPEIQNTSRSTVRMSPPYSKGTSSKAAVEELEQHMLQEALIASGYNQVQAARRLGLSRQGLIKKLKRYGIVPRPSTL